MNKMRIKALQIQPHGIFTDDAAIIAARGEFAAKQSVLLSEFVEPVTLARLMKLLSGVTVGERLHVGKSDDEILARELCVESDPMVLRALVFLFNRPELFRIVEQITNCQKIGKFDGRIYMMRPDSEHYHSWHDDLDGNHLIGLSLNLSGERYSGGSFQIREQKTERILNEIFNTIAGDAHIFNIASEFQHRVAPVTGTAAKVAFAGWFQIE